MVKCQEELLLFLLLLLIHRGRGSLPTVPEGLRSLSGPSSSIPSPHYEILADSSSVLLNNPNISCLWLQLYKECARVCVSVCVCVCVCVCVARTQKSHFPVSIYVPDSVYHSYALQTHPSSKPLLLFPTWNLLPFLAQLSGLGSSSSPFFPRESSWISPA